MTGEIGVLIVEREGLFRRGVAGCLEADPMLKVIASVGTAEEGFRQADELLPNVALVGTTLPDAPGLAAAGEMRRRYPAMATVVVAEAESDDELFEAIRAGAAAYLGKDVPEEQLVAVVKRTALGEYVINEQLLSKPYVAARVLEQFRAATASELAPTNAFAPLTDRELEILGRVSNGMTNAQIGAALGISPQTVKNHVTSILRKLAVNDRTQAVVLALRRGWLTMEGDGGEGGVPGGERRSRRSQARSLVEEAGSEEALDVEAVGEEAEAKELGSEAGGERASEPEVE